MNEKDAINDVLNILEVEPESEPGRLAAIIESNSLFSLQVEKRRRWFVYFSLGSIFQTKRHYIRHLNDNLFYQLRFQWSPLKFGGTLCSYFKTCIYIITSHRLGINVQNWQKQNNALRSSIRLNSSRNQPTDKWAYWQNLRHNSFSFPIDYHNCLNQYVYWNQKLCRVDLQFKGDVFNLN